MRNVSFLVCILWRELRRVAEVVQVHSHVLSCGTALAKMRQWAIVLKSVECVAPDERRSL